MKIAILALLLACASAWGARVICVSDGVSPNASNAANGGGYNPATYAGTIAALMGANDTYIAVTTDATYTDASKTIAKVGAFADANIATGLLVHINSGTNVTAGFYEIASHDDDTIVLTTSAGAGGAATDIACRVGGTITWAQLTTMMAATGVTGAAAGDSYYIKAGTYTLSASSTWTTDGSAADPICITGCDTSWAPLVPTRAAGNLLLVTTGMPQINYNGAYNWAANGSDNLIVSALRITSSAKNDFVFLGGTNCVVRGCSVESTHNGNSVGGISVGNSGLVNSCDADCTGATAGAVGINLGSTGARAIGCVVSQSKSYGIRAQASACIVAQCVVYGCENYGIYLSSTTTSHILTVLNNTIYGPGIGFADAAYANLHVIAGNHITNGVYAINGPASYSAPVALSRNWTHDNSSGETPNWAGSWDAATQWNTIVTSQTDANNFVDAANKNFNLKAASLGRLQGVMGANIGAMSNLAVLPPVASVLNDAGTWGEPASVNPGTYVAIGVEYVEQSHHFGPASALQGTLVLPDENVVVDGVFYGRNSAVNHDTDNEGALIQADPANVWHGSGLYGYANFAQITPTKTAASIVVSGGAEATLTAADIKTGVTVDPTPGANIEGSASGGGVIFIDD